MDAIFRLSAIEAIKRVKALYVRGTDSRDWELFGSAFALDAEWDLSGFSVARHADTGAWNPIGSGFDLAFLQQLSGMMEWPVKGRAAIIEGGRAVTSQVDATYHALFNPEIDILSEDSAKAIWPFEDTIHFSEGAPIRFFHGLGYYIETYVRVDGEWLTKTVHMDRRLLTISPEPAPRFSPA